LSILFISGHTLNDPNPTMPQISKLPSPPKYHHPVCQACVKNGSLEATQPHLNHIIWISMVCLSDCLMRNNRIVSKFDYYK
jgi:hypothetical protein